MHYKVDEIYFYSNLIPTIPVFNTLLEKCGDIQENSYETFPEGKIDFC